MRDLRTNGTIEMLLSKRTFILGIVRCRFEPYDAELSMNIRCSHQEESTLMKSGGRSLKSISARQSDQRTSAVHSGVFNTIQGEGRDLPAANHLTCRQVFAILPAYPFMANVLQAMYTPKPGEKLLRLMRLRIRDLG